MCAHVSARSRRNPNGSQKLNLKIKDEKYRRKSLIRSVMSALKVGAQGILGTFATNRVFSFDR